MSEEQSGVDRRLTAWLEEYKSLAADVGARVGLQQSNASLAIVFISGLTGYVVTYWTSHGLHSLLASETALLLTLVPIIGQFFIWRHIDHDWNIIDKANYIDKHIRPGVQACCGDPSVLSFEQHLRIARQKRAALSLLGNEHIVVFGAIGVYLATCWYVIVSVPHAAGQGHGLFVLLVYIGTALTGASLWTAAVTGWRYTKIGIEAPTIERAPDPSDHG
ncbi:MAG: hypothetical protein WBA31_10150 [Candidatus Dormiibacterota bacterium]